MTDPLCPAAVLAIGGRDAIDFAHAQFSTDVKSLAAGRWHWSAWLDPHGRVRTFFALLRVEPARLLAWLPLGDAAAMSEALSRFRLRSAVQLEAQAWALHASESMPSVLVRSDQPGEWALELDWGVVIPLSVLAADLDPDTPIAVVCPSPSLSRLQLIALGTALVDAADEVGSRVALIVSADQGHGHAADGRYGFAPEFLRL